MQSPYGKWMKNILQKFIKEILCEEYYDNSKIYFNFTEIKKLIKCTKIIIKSRYNLVIDYDANFSQKI